jgi:hypothetical protein
MMAYRRPSLRHRMPPGPLAHLVGWLLIPAIGIAVALMLPLIQWLCDVSH